MNKTLKKTLGVLLSVSMIAASAVLPMTASAAGETPLVAGDTVTKEWKLSFGSETAPSGYTHVPKTAHAVLGDTADGEDLGLGFIGTHADDFNFANNHDGLTMVQGHVTQLKETANGVGSTGDGLGGNGFEYPLRFALNAADGDYFRVKMELTNLDAGNATDVTVYAERKHNITSHETITAGETKTLEFSVDVEPNYFKGPAKTFADGQLNIVVAGENVAVKSMIIQQVTPGTTLWILGDSTVTDGNDTLPYFELDNYTGVGSGTTKYLPKNVAMSNQGEGGLNATDASHFAIARDRIKAGDFMWVEYGHNHKNGNGQSYTGEYWLNNYLQSLPKYYNACKTPAKGGTANGGKATLLMVGPIDRNQDSQYDASTNTWRSTLSGFSNLAKQYVDVLMYGGEDEAAKFLTQWASIAAYAEAHKSDSNAAAELATMKAAADKIVTDAVAGGEVKVSNVAFVDLNAPAIAWLTKTSESGSVGGETVTNSARLTDFYYRTGRGATSRKGTDNSHPNDAGAEAFAELFFLNAASKIAEYPILAPLLQTYEGTTPADNETPTGRHASPVNQKILDAGWAGNTTYWPDVVSKYAYAVRVKKINFNDEGKLESVDVLLQDNGLMSSYGQGIIAVYNKTTGALEGVAFSSAGDESKAAGMLGWVDNSNDPGTYTLAFDGSNLTYDSATQNLQAFIWSMGGDDEPLTMQPYSNDNENGQFVPLEYEYLLTNDSLTGPEQFHFYGIKADETIATGQNGWTISGVTAKTKSEMVNEEDAWYGNIAGTGSMTKSLDTSMSDGILEVSGKIRKTSGTVNVQLSDGTNHLTLFTVDGTGVKDYDGTAVDGVTLGDDWTAFTYTLDLDQSKGKLTAGTAEGTEKTISEYNNINPNNVKPLPVKSLRLNMTSAAAELTDLAVKSMTRTTDLPKYTVTADYVTGSTADMGTLTTSVETANAGSNVTYKAVNKAGYKFVGWYTDAEGTTAFALTKSATARVIGNTTLYAKFEVNDGIYFEEYFDDYEVSSGKLIIQGGYATGTTTVVTPDPIVLDNITIAVGARGNGAGSGGVYAQIKADSGNKYLEVGSDGYSSNSRGIRVAFNAPYDLKEATDEKPVVLEFDTKVTNSGFTLVNDIGTFTAAENTGLKTGDWVKVQVVFDKAAKKQYFVVRNSTTGDVLSIDTADLTVEDVTNSKGEVTKAVPVITGMNFYTASSGTVLLDNIRIYDLGTAATTAANPTLTTVTAPKGTVLTIAGNTYTVPEAGSFQIGLYETAYAVTGICEGYNDYSGNLTPSGGALTVPMVEKSGKPTTVTVNYLNSEDDSELKTATTVSKDTNGNDLYTGDAFTLTGISYMTAIKVANEADSTKYDVYVYDESTSDSFAIATLADTNKIDLKFRKIDGLYYEYEDFEATTDKWGFTEGNGGNVVASDGLLGIYLKSGTSPSQQPSDVKTFSETIQAAKKINVTFDWRSDAAANNTRNSYFNLRDSNDTAFFTMFSSGKQATFTVLGGSAVEIAKTSGVWFTVSLDLDFNTGKLSGTVTNKSTNAVTNISETSISNVKLNAGTENETTVTAANLAKLTTDYGYSSAAQALDNFSIKDISE